MSHSTFVLSAAALLLLAGVLTFAVPIFTVNYSYYTNVISPQSIVWYIPITLTNSQYQATPVPFQYMLTINSVTYSDYEATNLDNAEFFYPNGTIIPSWLQSGGISSTNSVYWLRLNSPIAGNSDQIIYIGFSDLPVSLLDGNNVGEAPTLSQPYGHYDNGNVVFSAYGDFSGTSSLDGWGGYSTLQNQHPILVNQHGVQLLYLVPQGRQNYLVAPNPMPSVPTIVQEEWNIEGQNYGFGTSIFGSLPAPNPMPNCNIIPALQNSVSFGFDNFVPGNCNGTYPSIFLKDFVSNSLTSAPFDTWNSRIISSYFIITNSVYAEVGYTPRSDKITEIGEQLPQPVVSQNIPNVFSGQSLLVGAVSRSGDARLSLAWLVAHSYLPNDTMPSEAFGPVLGKHRAMIYMQNNSIAYGTTENIFATAYGDNYEVFLNGNLIIPNTTNDTIYTFQINAAGIYTFNAIDMNSLYSHQETLNVYRATPEMWFYKFPQSYDENGLTSVITANISTIGNQIAASFYANTKLLGNNFTTSASNVLGPVSQIDNIIISTNGNQNYTAATFSNNFNIYPNSQQYGANTPQSTNGKIKHVIIITQENRAFDNFFGTYPGVSGINMSVCIPYNTLSPNLGCVKPFLTTNESLIDLAHSWEGSHQAYNNGLMNGFVYAAKSWSANANATYAMSYYNNQTIADYWMLAHNYVLTDHLFSSVLSYSLPNHWYIIAANAPELSYLYGTAVRGPTRNQTFYANNAVTALGYSYLNESNHTKTIADVFSANGLSWTLYGTNLPVNYTKAVKNGVVFNYWDPLLAKNTSYTIFSKHFEADNQIFTDLKQNKLPDLSWVVPPAGLSDHPPANITLGSWYVTDIVDSVMNSSSWNSTAIIILWDDYGGFYDGVPPPQVENSNGSTSNELGLSFRVPGIIISPYAKQNFVDHTDYSFESTLKFVERIWNLSNLTSRDGNANDIMNAFYFNQSPRAPQIIPLSANQIAAITPILSGAVNTSNILIGGHNPMELMPRSMMNTYGSNQSSGGAGGVSSVGSEDQNQYNDMMTTMNGAPLMNGMMYVNGFWINESYMIT